MMEPTGAVTRGKGLFEGFLARQRALLADRLIPEAARSGRILDIGCGTFPLFLTMVRFHEKHGLDKVSAHQMDMGDERISIRSFDIETDVRLPCPDQFFEVVTMLAVFEHIEPSRLPDILQEIFRVLKDGGSFIMTTPAPSADRLLRLLAKCNLVSREEIEEHKGAYSHRMIADFLEKSGFDRSNLRHGRFEAGLNLWVCADKQP
jgi:ubiquinone/menaquinone biosynthesis C-methylase UbiE